MNWFIGCFQKYAVFSGRARRKEYWMFMLFGTIVSLVLSYISLALQELWSLAVFVPAIAVGSRRMHDIGKSGWLQLLGLIPVVGWIILLVFFCQDSNPGANAFGPNPKDLTE